MTIPEGRLLVVVAHPDDETLAAGALLSRRRDTWLLHLTDGAPHSRRFRPTFTLRSRYAATRRRELEAAMALAGLAPERLRRVAGIADQEAAFALPQLARAVASLCGELAPDAILTHAYEGGHPDHDAAAFAVHAAAELLGRAGSPPPPPVFEAPLYRALPEGGSAVQEFPPGSADVEVHPLTEQEQRLKERMIGCFATQRKMLTVFLPTRPESFRPAPAHNFARAPHPGLLQYERWRFPLSGERFRELAQAAARELDLDLAQP